MKKFEFMVLGFERPKKTPFTATNLNEVDPSAQGRLNALGQDGWSIKAVSYHPAMAAWTVFLEREI